MDSGGHCKVLWHQIHSYWLCFSSWSTEPFSYCVEQMPVGWSKKPVVAHLYESIRQDVLEESANKLLGTKRAKLSQTGIGLLILESHFTVLQLQDAIVGNCHPEDVWSQITKSFLAAADGFAVQDPLFLPHGGVYEQEEIGFLELVSEFGSEQHRQRLCVNKEVFAGCPPLAGICKQASTGNQIVNVRMIEEVSRPRLQHADHADLAPDKSWIAGKLLQSRRRAAKEDTIEPLLMAAHEVSEFFGDGESHHEVENGEKQMPLSFEPFLGLVVLTFGTVPVFARVIAVVILLTGSAEIDLTAKHFGAALFDGFHGL